MARIQLNIGTRFLWHSELYIVREWLTNQRVRIENLSFGGQHLLSYDELVHQWQTGQLRFELKGPNLKTALDQPAPTEYSFSDFQALPEAVREESWRRYNLLLPLLQLAPKERSRERIRRYAAELQEQLARNLSEPDRELAQTRQAKGIRAKVGQALSTSSLELWLRRFIESGYDIRSLVPRTSQAGGKNESRLQKEAETVLETIFDKCEKEPQYRTVGDVLAMLASAIAEENRYRPEGEQLELPSRATVYRRIKVKKLERLLRRAPSRSEMQSQASVQPGPTLQRPLERVEIDHSILDLFVVDEEDRLPIGRPTLTVALDVYTKLPFGIYVSFEPPSYLAVQNCLLHGILPKPDCRQLYGTTNDWPVYGLPQTLVVDNGKEFRGQSLSEACTQLGITLWYTPPRKPWFKGSVERYFRTLNTGLIHPLPGTTFSKVVERGDYDPAKHACISLTAFRRLLHIFLLDVYAQRWHEGLQGVPAKRWTENIQAGFTPSLAHSAEEVKILLYASAQRTLQRSGLDFESLRYQSPELARLRSQLGAGATVRLKYDPADLSAVYLSDPAGSSSEGWLRVAAVDQEYTAGLSLWKHRLIRSYVLHEKNEVDIYALAEAKERIRQVVEQEFKQTRQSQQRKRGARFLGSGSAATSTTLQPVTPTPQELAPATKALQPVSVSQELAPVAKPGGEKPVESEIVSAPATSPLPPEKAHPNNSPAAARPEQLRERRWGADYNLPRSLNRSKPAKPKES